MRLTFRGLGSRLRAWRRGSQAAMPFVMLTVLIDMISIGLIVPVLPALVGGFTDSQGDMSFWFGAVVFAFGIANFFGAPVLGALSDTYGRRPILLLGFCGLGLNLFATGLAGALWVLVAVRLVAGALQANAAVANAYVADITPPEARTRRFGLLGAMTGVGFIIGPVAGGLLGAVDLRLPFFAGGALSMVNLLYGVFVMPESLPPERRRRFRWKAANPLGALRGLARLEGVGPLMAVVALNALAQFTGYSSWVLFATFKFGWGPWENGWCLAASGGVSVVVQGLLMGRLLRHLAPFRLTLAGLASAALSYAAFGAVPEGWMLYGIIVLNLFGYTVLPAIQGLVSATATPRTQGQVMGAVAALNSLMAVFAPMLSAPLLALVSGLPRGDWRIGGPLYFCAALEVAALGCALVQVRRGRKKVFFS